VKPLYTDAQFNDAKSRDLLPFECERCGKTFYGVKNEIQKYFSRQKRGVKLHLLFKFCSKNCWRNGKEYECKQCGKVVYRTPTDFRNNPKNVFCSSSCSAIYTQKDGGNRMWSEEEKLKQKQIAKNNPKFCGWNKGKRCLKTIKTETLKCSHCGNDFVQIISKRYSNKIKTCSKECRSKIQSAILKLQYKNGKKVYGGKTKWVIYKNIKVQGTYEYRTCIILDKWKDLLKIKDWEYTNDRFNYVGIDGKKHNYLMDFKVWNNDGSFYYLETKGYKKLNDDLKWSSVRNGGFDLKVWFLKNIEDEENKITNSSA